MSAVITLLTDFGARDPFVGIMKAVIIDRAPTARLIDLTHEVAPQDVREGALALASAVPYCPRGAIHVGVVDPGVGTARRAVVVQTQRARYVAPDNGLLTLALDIDPPLEAWHLNRPAFFLPRPSRTFHGRDIFAPVAAHLACGTAPADMGDPIATESLVRFSVPPPRASEGRLIARVIHVDRFGNLVIDLHVSHAQAEHVDRIRAAGREVALAATYADVAEGALLALWGSSGRLELSVRGASAADALSLATGDEIEVLLAERSPS